jgi:hypothetical protein
LNSDSTRVQARCSVDMISIPKRGISGSQVILDIRSSTASTASAETFSHQTTSPGKSEWHAQRSSTQSTSSSWSVQTPRSVELGLPFLEGAYGNGLERGSDTVGKDGDMEFLDGETSLWWAGVSGRADCL